MNLKEAFRYQNHLASLLDHADLYLSNYFHVVDVTQTHRRSLVDPDAHDEVLTSDRLYPQRGTHFDTADVVDFVMEVLKERRMLSIEITNVKRFASFQLDHELSCNKQTQRIAKRFGFLAAMRPKNQVTQGYGRRFNAEGNQITYAYEVEEQQSLAFDRDEMRRMSKEMLAAADEISNKAECFMLETDVVFEPIFDVNDSFEEAVESFIKYREAERVSAQ